MTIAASQPFDPDNGDTKYRQYGTINSAFGQPTDDRQAISLIAPGQPVTALGHGDIPKTRNGTSAAAPHVTATVGLLQQFAKPKVDAGNVPRWTENAQRHEVMKAVMMNAADKLEGVHGSTRDVLNGNGVTWVDSPAKSDPKTALDPWFGTGHLNALRSVQQYEPGEYGPGVIPNIGWDYQAVGDTAEYHFESEIGGGYLAATLVWDRRVQKLTGGNYSEGDKFAMQSLQNRQNNLDLYLMLADSNDFETAIDVSNSDIQNVEHIFFNIETPGEYRLVVRNNPVGGIGDTQIYALAWWFGDPTTPVTGDYDGNGSVGPEDYAVWQSTFGSTTELDADGNGDEVVNAADYVIWRDNFGSGSGSGSAVANVPEPSGLMLFAVAGTFFVRRRAAR